MNSHEEIEPWYFSLYFFISEIQVSELGSMQHDFRHPKVTASVG